MIEVLKAGMYDTIQDLGRFGYQDFGVPVSGVMDKYSGTLANSILGNSNDDAVLECAFVGPYLKFNHETAICLSGADMNAKLNDLELKTNHVYQIKTGDVLKFGQRHYGCYAYLAVLGGFQTEEQMRSRSQYRGVTSSYRLSKGDILPIMKPNNLIRDTFSSVRVDRNHFQAHELDVYEGPEFSKLNKKEQVLLLNSTFSISKDSNRMAYQFDDTFDNSLEGMITSLVLPGTVQLTPSGKLIVLMRDCQITGGYPRILQLTEKSINKLVQQFIGHKIAFKCIK
jgi:biotin-dependent carboxylase-like uncharacterized protein